MFKDAIKIRRSLSIAITLFTLAFIFALSDGLADRVFAAEDPAQGLLELKKTTDEFGSGKLVCQDPARTQPGCSETLEAFCKELYAKPNQGNLDVQTSIGTEQIRTGVTANGYSQEFFAYSKAKIAAAGKFPTDFEKRLQTSGYFGELKDYLASPDIRKLSKREELEHNRRSDAVSSRWNSAFQETLIQRMETRFPGYDKLDPVPMPIQFEAGEEAEKLDKEINQAIWKDNPRWKNVEVMFEQVRTSFIEYIESNPQLSPTTRIEWLRRIRTMKLALPRNLPGIEGCTTTLQNAFYLPSEHNFTVCAGLFNSFPDFAGTIAHEMAHSLGPSTDIYLQIRDSDLGKKVFALQKVVCEHAPLQECPEEWKDLSAPGLLDQYARALGSYHPTLPTDFLDCLQYTRPDKFETATPDYFSKRSRDLTRGRNGELADDDIFLLLTKKERIFSDARRESNPNYLNPCGLSRPKLEDFSLEGAQAVLFTTAYLCDHSNQSSAQKITTAAATAAEMQSKILTAVIPFGGKYSHEGEMIGAGFAENPNERFADSLGNSVYARLLKNAGTNIHDRRQLFVSASARRCDPPSLQLEYPDEAQAQKLLSLEPHSAGKQRRLELLSQPIREVLQCEKDFEIKDCVL